MTKILIADDDRGILKILKTILIQAKYEVEGACDGLEALDKFKNFSPDLIIMDANMPNMNGLEATKKIKSINPHTKFILLTAHDDSETITEFLDAGVDYFLAKPLGKEQLLRGIVQTLNNDD